MGAIAGALGGDLLGGIAGGQKKKSGGSTTGQTISFIDTTVSQQEKDIQAVQQEQFDALRGEIGREPEFLSDFNTLLRQLSSGQLSPERQQAAAQFARDITAGEETQLNQSIEDINIQNQRLAARLGRQANDPILQAKVAQEEIRQRQSLAARRTEISAGLPFQQLGLLGQGVQQSNALQQQALQNRQALFGIGTQFASQLRTLRLDSARKINQTTGTQNFSSGGGFAGFAAGALSGASGGLNLASSFPSGGGGTSGGGSTPIGSGGSAPQLFR